MDLSGYLFSRFDISFRICNQFLEGVVIVATV